MDSKTFNDAMIELVTVNGKPFSAVEDSGLCMVIDPIKSPQLNDGQEKNSRAG